MLNFIIQFSLRHRLVILCAAIAVMVLGSIVAQTLPIDVLPSLTRPRVVIVTECEGMAPEEVEQRVTFPLEANLNGAAGVIAVRSSSGIGLSVINVEFDWDTDVQSARQIVQERLTLVVDQMPAGVKPQMGPRSSLLGQIALVAMWSEDGSTSPMELRTTADWVVRQRLKKIPGVSQVITMGGDRKQIHVQVDQHQLHRYEVSLAEVESALRDSNKNVTGGFISRDGKEFLIRGIGRYGDVDEIGETTIRSTGQRALLLKQVAKISEVAQIKRGDSSVNGQSAVVLTIQKQPGADTRLVTESVHAALAELRPSLPADVELQTTYEQREFIDHSVANVLEALRDGAILVVVVLFLFLLNFRTTFITLTAIPLSVLVTALVFRWLGLSINVMTLGGLAVAMGELVDDAIVDVENIARRLKENALSAKPKSALAVIFDASVEVRNAIIVSTVLVVIVFAPLFALTGMEGRLFAPLGVAYLVSIAASTLVSLTVTPVLSSFLLPKAKATHRETDGWLLRGLKRIVRPIIRFSMHPVGLTASLSVLGMGCVVGSVVAWNMGRDFLPPFDEGAAQVNLFAPPGTSLEVSRELSQMADRNLTKLLKSETNPTGPLLWFTCRTGRAEQDEHVMGVNISEYVITLNPDSGLSREELIEQLHEAVEHVPGVETEVEQPIAHLISHMLSGVTAQIAIKLYGDDLETLREEAEHIKHTIESIPGIAPPIVEQQQPTPQIRVELKKDMLAYHGVTAGFVNHFIETALHGQEVSQLIDGQRTFDILLRLKESQRRDLANLHRVPMELPNGRRVPLGTLANVYETLGPNTIHREDGRRRIVVRVNTLGRDVGSVVSEIKDRITAQVELPEGYFLSYEGQFEAQQKANQRIFWLSLVALVGVLLVLISTYSSLNIALQLLIALPAAFVGGILGLYVTGQTFSVAATVGFVSLGGIAARNGLLLVSTYFKRSQEEGVSENVIVEGSLDRLAPVMMTALTTGLGLVPLVIGGHLPGKEILFPVATVILGGLITATMAEFLIRPGLFWLLLDDRTRIEPPSVHD
ncbi:efflux RND transporter permease subunit [Rhodopirellula sp. JC740]|uniref:Efflux RND transporter permease subunit n=1 Tax=Rhodopirellula halodulae TaxID=2894198 RepID=A0ABS8NI25_9BACT|nr:efflux RND transporter permease subunit [Rhodopirellula sp. JC740]MCC9643214.1 efflux RND transporter permease subunit [Rhodopirellula sp. JC740]